MRNVFGRALGCILSLVVAAPQVPGKPQDAPKLGAARGFVLDQAGKPVSRATVFVAGSVRVLNPSAVTGDDGGFLLKNISGDLGLLAFKEADGYPFNFAAFFSNPGEQFPYIHVNPGAVTENVIIRLGAKAATLKFQILDERGQTISVAAATLTRPDMPDIEPYRSEILLNGKILVPAVPMRIQVDAEGFKTWRCGGEEWQTDRGLTAPQPGQILNLKIQLRRSEPSGG